MQDIRDRLIEKLRSRDQDIYLGFVSSELDDIFRDAYNSRIRLDGSQIGHEIGLEAPEFIETKILQDLIVIWDHWFTTRRSIDDVDEWCG